MFWLDCASDLRSFWKTATLGMRTNNPSLRPAGVLKRVGDVDTEGVDNLPWLGANEVLDISWKASPISSSDIMLNNRVDREFR